MWFMVIFRGYDGIYHLVMTNIAMERSTMFSRQTIYKWAIFHGYVKEPEGNIRKYRGLINTL